MNNLDFIRQEVPVAGRNPTPVPLEAAKAMLFEEIADVLLCLAVLRIDLGHPVIRGTVERKLDRWARRVKEEKP